MIVIEPVVLPRLERHWYVTVDRTLHPPLVMWQAWVRLTEWLVMVVHTVYPNGDVESRVVRN